MYSKRYIRFALTCLWLLTFSVCIEHAAAKEFVVVIDPGHGGNDPGAVGKISKEKNINLKVAQKLGKRIQNNCKDVKVVYTRDKDVFVSLDRRAEIANNSKADLFISIHTNALANNHTIKGASTWTLGLARSEANLNVAKRENSVILYEDDYKTRYAGFDPNSSESYIIFEFMQDKYMSQSVHFASQVQQHFKKSCLRTDRGVHQAGFLVLKASAMPSVLIELGFISTPEEERYLNSEEGTDNLAKGIYLAFIQYKEEHQNRLAASGNEPVVQKEPETMTATTQQQQIASADNSRAIFKIQILASAKPLADNNKEFKGLTPIDSYRESNLYKYTYGASEDYNEMVRMRKGILSKFQKAFIIAFKDGKKVNINEAIAEFKHKK